MMNHPNLRLVGYDADVSWAPYISGTKGGDSGEDRRNIQFALKLMF